MKTIRLKELKVGDKFVEMINDGTCFYCEVHYIDNTEEDAFFLVADDLIDHDLELNYSHEPEDAIFLLVEDGDDPIVIYGKDAFEIEWTR
jgi:hypothetical protein